MGKSTINDHVQLQTVSSPEGNPCHGEDLVFLFWDDSLPIHFGGFSRHRNVWHRMVVQCTLIWIIPEKNTQIGNRLLGCPSAACAAWAYDFIILYMDPPNTRGWLIPVLVSNGIYIGCILHVVSKKKNDPGYAMSPLKSSATLWWLPLPQPQT